MEGFVVLNIKALTFDTGGTLLDWHHGVASAIANIGMRRGLAFDWPTLTNEYRRAALKMMANQEHPDFNMDDVHRRVFKRLANEHNLHTFIEDDYDEIAHAWHVLDAWPDFPPALQRLRARYLTISFTILSAAIVMDVSRRNDLTWDLVASCELLGIYKPQPQSYLKVAKLLQLTPSSIMMVACHNYDLDAARLQGYRTAFVRRPMEWGNTAPPDPEPNPAVDIVVQDFGELADILIR
jgi:2-haloacid dehalogenase